MIHSFDDDLTQEIFHGMHSHALRKKYASNVVKDIERKLDLLNAAHSLEDFFLIPTTKPDAAVRDAHGKYSIPINGDYRLTFRWSKEGPTNVEVRTSYHAA